MNTVRFGHLSVTNGNRPLPPRAQQPFAAIQVSLSQRHRFTERTERVKDATIQNPQQ